MNCEKSTCCNCKLNDLKTLCSIAIKNRQLKFDVLVERLKREIKEYEIHNETGNTQ